MAREEEIARASKDYHIKRHPDFTFGEYVAFIDGAKWADAHPDIDVRTMAAWRGGYKEAIEKACEWLDCYIDNYLFIDAENKSGIKWDDFINDFKQAMKGGEE